MDKQKIKIIKNGPYKVTGNVQLSEKIIVPKEKHYEYRDGKEFPSTDSYLLCRCGHSKKHPFCDGAHSKIKFDGTETASKKPFKERAEVLEGPGVRNRQTLCRCGKSKIKPFCDLAHVKANFRDN